jgi:Asp-tRNA(Asn)/Glu-tRNA(Gln) amidotransferase A subunit family amidase
VEDAAKRLEQAGAQIHDVSLPASFTALDRARTIVNPYERARALAHEWNTHRALLSPRLARQIEEGLAVSHADYRATLAAIAACRSELGQLFAGVDVLLTPCTNGEAPKGLDITGDPKFQEFWTALHVPPSRCRPIKAPMICRWAFN